ncbi:centromere protein L-like [Amphiura filiformis]|uniref:centromere protein L-like n=1 Tax=Amphiura filiformis TaxID=82378 RepID=UPI003B20D0B3
MDVTPQSQVVRFDTSQSSTNTSTRSHAKPPSWPIRRYTPYSKTPRSRKLNTRMGRIERTPVVGGDSETDLKKLVNKTWHVYQVTPLADFKQDAASLRKYSKHLSAFLQAESQKGIGVDVENIVGDRAVFSLMQGLASSPDDSEAVELVVKVKSQANVGAASSTRETLHAILCSVGADINRKETLHDSLAMLPVLIMKGTVAVSTCVIKWLESQFDCHIKRMTFNQMKLAWIIPIWAGAGLEDVSKPIELQYTVPKDIEGLNTITLTVEHQDAQTLWESVHDGSSNEVSGEEIAAFIKSLEAHFFYHFKIHLEGMSLTRIGTPLAFMGCEGRIKIFQGSGVIQILQYLTELATEDKFGLYTH